MDITQTFYDNMATQYDKLFLDWNATIGCFQCAKKQKCVFDDKLNEFTALATDYDGFIFGSAHKK